jgi:hypothetical protein
MRVGEVADSEGPSTVPFGAMVLGLRLAVGRFQQAGRAPDPVGAAIPLFEALNWAVALDERLRKDWIPDGKANPPEWEWPTRLTDNEGHAEMVRAVRFIRDRVHHQWADAVLLGRGGGHYPPRDHAWIWVAAVDLPEADSGHDRHRGSYERLLEGKAAEYTLVVLAEIYQYVMQLLEPLGPPRRWIAEDV